MVDGNLLLARVDQKTQAVLDAFDAKVAQEAAGDAQLEEGEQPAVSVLSVGSVQ
jgi:hypothetical protein